MINQRFGSLVVLRRAPPGDKWRRSVWECMCDCGNEVAVVGKSLRNSAHPSCGCIHPATLRSSGRKYGTVEDCLANTSRSGDCMEWGGHRNAQGYPYLGHYKAKHVQSLPALGHRRVFFLLHGYLPEVVMHTCDNPSCINPEHLKAGNKKTNAQDSVQKGRFNRSKLKYKIKHEGQILTLHEYSVITGIPMATLQWRARNGKLPVVPKDKW